MKNLTKHNLLFLQCITEEIDGCKINPQSLSATKIREHIPSDFSMKISMMYTRVKIL